MGVRIGVSGGVGGIALPFGARVGVVSAEEGREPSMLVRRRLRTLSWTRERRDGCVSSRMPASRALLSGRGECILPLYSRACGGCSSVNEGFVE